MGNIFLKVKPFLLHGLDLRWESVARSQVEKERREKWSLAGWTGRFIPHSRATSDQAGRKELQLETRKIGQRRRGKKRLKA